MLPHLLLATLLLMISQPAQIQSQGIAFDAASTASGADSDMISWSHTVTTSETNRILIVGISFQGDPPDADVDTVTYNGINLTRVGTVSNAGQVTSQIWRLVNPATGTHTVEVTLNQANKVIAGAASFLNVDQTTPVGTLFSANGKSTSASLNVTSVAEGEVVVDTLALKDGSSASVGSGQGERWNANLSSDVRTAGSTKPGRMAGGPSPCRGHSAAI